MHKIQLLTDSVETKGEIQKNITLNLQNLTAGRPWQNKNLVK